MKKLIIMLLMMLSSIECCLAGNLRFDNGIAVNSASSVCRNVETSEDAVKVTYIVNSVDTVSDSLYPECYSLLIEGFTNSAKVGDPGLPIRSDRILVPNGADAAIDIMETEYVDIPMSISPARPDLIDSDDESFDKKNVQPVKSYAGFYPMNIVENCGIEVYRGQKVMTASLNVAQYNYNTKTVRLYTKVVYKVQFEMSEGSSLIEYPENSGDIDNFIINIQGNVQTRFSTKNEFVTRAATPYLILTTSKFKNVVDKFSHWKRLLGYDVKAIIKDGWTQELIKQSIKADYLSRKTEYLLIVGDNNEVPGEDTPISIADSYGGYVTDYYYTCMDGEDDTFSDIHRGRIPVATEEEANVVLDKICQYELNPSSDNEFYNNVLACSYFESVDNARNREKCRFVLTSEEIRSYLVGKGKSVERIYKTDDITNPKYWANSPYGLGNEIPIELQRPSFSWTGDSTDIINGIERGAFLVYHRDHGLVNGWGDPYFRVDNVKRLNNSLYPVVLSINCSSGAYQHNGDSFVEAFLKNAEGGCVGIIGATRVSYSGYNDALTVGIIDAIWPSPGLIPQFGSSIPNNPSTYVTNPLYRLGAALDQGFVRMEETFGSRSKAYSNLTKAIFHYFGDPSMMLPTEMPTRYANVRIHRRDGNIVISSDEFANLTLYNKKTGEYLLYKGRYGTFNMQNPEDVIVVLSGHNKIPYIDEVVHANPLNYSIYCPKIYNFKVKVKGSSKASIPRDCNIIVENLTNGKYFKVKGNFDYDTNNYILELSDQLFDNLVIQDDDILKVTFKDLSISEFGRPIELYYQYKDDLIGFSVSPTTVSDFESSIRFDFDERLAVLEAQTISPGVKGDVTIKIPSLNWVVFKDSYICQLTNQNWASNGKKPQLMIKLSDVTNSDSFKYPEDYFNTIIRYDSSGKIVKESMSSVNELGDSDDNDYTIFDIYGRRMRVESIEDLGKGVYVVNGKLLIR